jgi:hypothetical protein
MWSFAEPLGSHSPCTKLKTHYSEQLHCYNNTLLNLVLSEHSPAGPTIRGNCEKGDDDELTGTFVAVFLLIRLF